MKFMDRSVLVIKPKKPYLDWTRSVYPDGVQLEPDDIRQDCTTYLLGEALDRRHLEQFLQENYQAMFEYELCSWHRDASAWPAERSYEDFCDWFDVEIHSAVIDLLNQSNPPDPA